MKRSYKKDEFKGFTTYIHREDEGPITREETERIYRLATNTAV